MPPPRKTRGRGTGGARGAARSETSVVAASAPWPADVRYVTSLVFGDDVRHGARGLYEKYRPSGDAPIEASPAQVRKTVRWMRVTEEGHPALGEHGLFAARKLAPGERCVDYLGLVTLNGNESETSDYSATFGDEHELALDAATVGNEARMCNDYRGTGRRPNAVFDQYRDAAGDLKLAIFVGPKPVAKGEELLVSYGKGFWLHRVGDLGAFRAGHRVPPHASASEKRDEEKERGRGTDADG